LWYPTLFICGLALILGIIAIVTIKLKKGALGGIKLVKGGICLVLLCFIGLYILKLKTMPIIHIELCRAALRNLDEAIRDNNDEWPPGPTWCDVLHDKYGKFICPADNVGPCSYAINEHAVNLGTSIPRNMVLLFESKPGWNQVGGPELLNKTNHNGSGCNVSFGDGHIEFVPTSKLGDLRWEANEDKEK
jgi:prepilin-type processing-associated H-X9-DG protein